LAKVRTRNVAIYISPIGDLAYATVGSKEEAELVAKKQGFTICTAVDDGTQAVTIFDGLLRAGFFQYGGPGCDYAVHVSWPLSKAELQEIAGRIEEKYQELQTETGDSA
jgi:hypothetical protein